MALREGEGRHVTYNASDLSKCPLLPMHSDSIGSPLSSINNNHIVGNDAMAMATMQGETSLLLLS